MKVIEARSVSARVKKVRSLIKSGGNQIMGIHFIKRSDGKKRKMACRSRVFKPTYAGIPKGKKNKVNLKQHNLVTVFDVNELRYNNKGRLCGRGSWKSIPLDGVERIKVGGIVYKIIS